MPTYSAVIQKVITNGPYAYAILKDGVGQTDVNGKASIGAALDGVKADIAGLLGSEVVQRVNMIVQSL